MNLQEVRAYWGGRDQTRRTLSRVLPEERTYLSSYEPSILGMSMPPNVPVEARHEVRGAERRRTRTGGYAAFA